MMRRRDFIGLVGGAAAWPFAAPAQQASRPVIGFLRSASAAEATELVAAFRDGLKEAGYVDGQNVAIEFRWAEGRSDRLPELAAGLIRRPVAVLVGDAFAMLAAKALTTSIPILFAAGGDPVAQGLVGSLNRPGGNVTGVHFFTGVLGAKRLQLLRQLKPNARSIAMLVHPGTPNTEMERRDVQAAAESIGQQLVVLDAGSEREIETAFAAFARRGAEALLCGSGPFMTAHGKLLIELAARHTLPACYHIREIVAEGGLMSYGASVADSYRQAGLYAARILKGENPGDLPVVRSTKFELAINLKTARTLGLDMPPGLLATADEVIE
jgi:putative ABC transport system substrate-binding protein